MEKLRHRGGRAPQRPPPGSAPVPLHLLEIVVTVLVTGFHVMREPLVTCSLFAYLFVKIQHQLRRSNSPDSIGARVKNDHQLGIGRHIINIE